VLLDEFVELQPFDPAHLEDRIPCSGDADTLFQVSEVYRERKSGPLEVLGDALVTFLQMRDFAGKTLYGPCVAGRWTVDLVDVGKITRPRHWEPLRRTDNLPAPQLLVVERNARILDRF
jgi:hypothetical protein